MRNSMRLFVAASLVTFGYFLGSTPVFRAAQAQSEEEMPSEDAIRKIGEAHSLLKAAAQQLITESRYTSVTKAVNPYSVFVGGINVKDDLESGHGVDPETFAALNVAAYDLKHNTLKEEKDRRDRKADKENEDGLADWIDTNLLGYDNNGRLTYRNKVVRLYSISRMRKLNAQRLVVLSGMKDHKGIK